MRPERFLATSLLLLGVNLLVTSCSGFALKNKKNRNASGPPPGKGFGGGAPTSPKVTTKTQSSGWEEIVLGPSKKVSIYVPCDTLSPDSMGKKEKNSFAKASSSSSALTKILDSFGQFRGKGDVIWPSSLHLSRLLANCPSFVAEKRVIDVGCGLGLASLASLLGQPIKMAISDIDNDVLSLAEKSCNSWLRDNKNPHFEDIKRLNIDWSEKETWPEPNGFDVVVAADVLYDSPSVRHLSSLIAHLLAKGESSSLSSPARALIVDPANRENRDLFVEHATNCGLEVSCVPFPGQEDEFVLINVVPNNGCIAS